MENTSSQSEAADAANAPFLYPSATKIQDMPSEMRPREEMKRRGGGEGMDAEKLLAIVMRSGQPGQNVVDLAKILLQRAGGLEALSQMNYLDILGLKIPGIGEVKAMELAAAFEIGRRAAANAPTAAPRKITSPEDVFEIMQPFVRGKQEEYFYAILLDVKNRMIGQPVLIAKGSRDRCPAGPSEIFSPAIKRGCASVVIVHNHPSGDPTPSREDVAISVRLVDAAKILNIRLLDHIVVGRRTDASPEGFVSLAGDRLVSFD